MDIVKFFQGSEEDDDPDFKLLMEQYKNFIDRLLHEKVAKTHNATATQLKTMLGYAAVNMAVVAVKLEQRFPNRSAQIEAATIIIASNMSLLISAVLIADLDEQQTRSPKRDDSIPNIKGTWYDKPDRNSN